MSPAHPTVRAPSLHNEVVLTWLCASLVLGQVPRTPVFRQELPNGTRIVAHSMPEADTFSVHFAFRHVGLEVNADLGSTLHLLEHFLARGESGSLAAKAESLGTWVEAYTTREAIHVAFTGPASEMEAALALAEEIGGLPRITLDHLELEQRIIQHELNLIPRSLRHVRSAWNLIGEGSRPDPFGSAESIQGVTFDDLNQVSEQLLVAPRVSIAMSGPAAVDDLAAAAEQLATRFRPSGEPVADWATPEWSPSIPPSPPGGGLAIITPSIGQPAGLANLAILLGFSLVDREWEPIYQPSGISSLMVLSGGNPESWMALQQGDANFRAEVLNAGYRALPQWIASQQRSPASDAAFRATLMSSNFALGPEQVLARVDLVSVELLSAAYDRWRQEGVRVRA